MNKVGIVQPFGDPLEKRVEKGRKGENAQLEGGAGKKLFLIVKGNI